MPEKLKARDLNSKPRGAYELVNVRKGTRYQLKAEASKRGLLIIDLVDLLVVYLQQNPNFLNQSNNSDDGLE